MKSALIRFSMTDGRICIMITPTEGHECQRYEITKNSLLCALADITDLVYRVFAQQIGRG